MPKLGEVQPKHAGGKQNIPQSCNKSQQENNPDPSATATTVSPPTATRYQVGTIPAVQRLPSTAGDEAISAASLARRTRSLSPPVTGQHVRGPPLAYQQTR